MGKNRLRNMKIVFFGTPDYVLPVIQTLHKEFKDKNGKSPIVAVVTQAPKPAGRKKELKYSVVDTWAHKRGVQKYYDPDDLIKDKVDADLGILASYGKIIPNDIIKMFPHGILNIHPSLLPLWRGASPVQATIISGSQAGVSIIKLDNKLDHGPIITQFKDNVLPDDTTETLRNRLFENSADVLATLIPAYVSGRIKLKKQDDTKATFTREIKKSDGFIPPKHIKAALQGAIFKGKWKISFMNDYPLISTDEAGQASLISYALERFIRAMQPWPEAWTHVQLEQSAKDKVQKRLKILKAHLEKSTINHQPLAIDTVQLEGKNPVSWKQFKEGYKFNYRFKCSLHN